MDMIIRPIRKSNNARDKGIQIGDSTQIHDHVILLRSFNTINAMARKHRKPVAIIGEFPLFILLIKSFIFVNNHISDLVFNRLKIKY